MENVMSKALLIALSVVLFPGVAVAEGSKGDRDRVSREVEAMQRDGRWERAIADGRANRQAFEDLLRGQQPATRYTATNSSRPHQR
jgi:hypothetical protein